jgi:putative transcriptional regulator
LAQTGSAIQQADSLTKHSIGVSSIFAAESLAEVLERDAMSKAFEEISAGLDDAIANAKGRKSAVIVHEPETIDVKAIRKKTGMSQQKFCTTFGISLGTLRHWEQGLRSPRGPARVLLKVVDHIPGAVIQAIGK